MTKSAKDLPDEAKPASLEDILADALIEVYAKDELILTIWCGQKFLPAEWGES